MRGGIRQFDCNHNVDKLVSTWLCNKKQGSCDLEFLFLARFMRSIKSIQQAVPHFSRILKYVNLLTRCPLCTDFLVKGCKSYCLTRLLMCCKKPLCAARWDTTWTWNRQTCCESSRRLVRLKPDIWSTKQSKFALHRYLGIPASAENENSMD